MAGILRWFARMIFCVVLSQPPAHATTGGITFLAPGGPPEPIAEYTRGSTITIKLAVAEPPPLFFTLKLRLPDNQEVPIFDQLSVDSAGYQQYHLPWTIPETSFAGTYYLLAWASKEKDKPTSLFGESRPFRITSAGDSTAVGPQHQRLREDIKRHPAVDLTGNVKATVEPPSSRLAARIVNPAPAVYFGVPTAVPITVETDCCLVQQEGVAGNFFDVQVERKVTGSAQSESFWQPLPPLLIPMAGCLHALQPCSGTGIVDLVDNGNSGLQFNDGNSVQQPTESNWQYRLRARARPFDTQEQVSKTGPWTDWQTFGYAKPKGPEKAAALFTPEEQQQEPASPQITDRPAIKRQIDKSKKNRPDLRVEFFAVASENPAYAGQYILGFKVTNEGPATAGRSILSVSCIPTGTSILCSDIFESRYRVPELAPQQSLIYSTLDTHKLVTPPPQGEVHFLAIIDNDHEVHEGAEGEGNNSILGIFPPWEQQPLAHLDNQQQQALHAQLLTGLEAAAKVGTQSAALKPLSGPTQGSLPTTLLLSGKKSYLPQEQVVFILRGSSAGKPELECSPDNLKWHAHCPTSMQIRTAGSGAAVRYLVQAPDTAMFFRVRIAELVSEPAEVIVQQTRTPSVTASAALPQPMALTTKTTMTGNKAVHGPEKPLLTLVSTHLVAPAMVKFSVQAEAGRSISYQLEKKEQNTFRKMVSASRPEFQVTDPGDYRVRACYNGSSVESVATFSVAAGAVKQPVLDAVKAPQRMKAPARALKMK